MLRIGALLLIGFLCTGCVGLTDGIRRDLQRQTAKYIGNNDVPEQIEIFEYRRDAYDHYWQAVAQNVKYNCSENFRLRDDMHCVKVKSAVAPEAKVKTEINPQNANHTSSSSMIVIANKTNLRKTPSKNAEIIKTLKKGEEVNFLKQKDEWFMIELASGEVGWCIKSFLTIK